MSRVDELVTSARAGVENLTPADLVRELDRGDVLLVDVREEAELDAGTLPGAVHVPRGRLEFVGLEPARRVVLLSGRGRRSALAASALQAVGHTDVAHLEGGLSRWSAEGRPTTRSTGTAAPATG